MTTVRQHLRRVVGLMGAAFLSGCYSYVPIQQPTPGMTVRVHVPVRSAMQDPNAPEPTLNVLGTVVSTGDSLVLATKNRREIGNFRTVMELDTLRVARSGISLMEEQVFSKPKTYGLTVLVTLGAAGLVAALVKAAGGRGGEGPPGNGGTGAQIRVRPIFQGIFGLIGR
jgi:hypothetical protein